MTVASGLSKNFLSQLADLGFHDSPPSSTQVNNNRTVSDAARHVPSPNLSFEFNNSNRQSVPNATHTVRSPTPSVVEIVIPTSSPSTGISQGFTHGRQFAFPQLKVWTWNVRFSVDDRNELAIAYLRKIVDVTSV